MAFSYGGMQTDTISIAGNNGESIGAYTARPNGSGSPVDANTDTSVNGRVTTSKW